MQASGCFEPPGTNIYDLRTETARQRHHITLYREGLSRIAHPCMYDPTTESPQEIAARFLQVIFMKEPK
jgi:hypothetical protein